jgi:hypothetical protein
MADDALGEHVLDLAVLLRGLLLAWDEQAVHGVARVHGVALGERAERVVEAAGGVAEGVDLG